MIDPVEPAMPADTRPIGRHRATVWTRLGGWCETALLKKVRGVELGSRHRIDVSGVDLCWALDGSRGTD